jgi:serine/threonine protein kinase
LLSRLSALDAETDTMSLRFAATRYVDLLAESLDHERWVRKALALLETDFRKLALSALAEWERLDVTAEELFQAVASLQRPSWGSWNGLFAALRNARKTLLRTQGATARQKFEQATQLHTILELLDQKLDDGTLRKLDALIRLTGGSRPSKVRLGFLLSLPISLRNRVAHDLPTDENWWTDAERALRPLIEYHATVTPLASCSTEAEAPAPWFLVKADVLFTFNGLTVDDAVVYVSSSGIAEFSKEQSGALLRSFARLMGKSEAQEADFRSLLGTLAPEDVKGVLMGDYLVGQPIGTGGFATVHVGRHLSTGRKVAVKILRDGMPEDVRLRFQQEARLLSQLNHPNIVSVYGYGEQAWQAPRAFSLNHEAWYDAFAKGAAVKSFIALEWIDGGTLDDVYCDLYNKPRSAGKPDSPPIKPDRKTLADWFRQSALALGTAHTLGIVHRDVKPNNLMVNARGQVKLMDFGIARLQGDSKGAITVDGSSPGTPAYMSPEQLRSLDADAEVGPATDIYSLCATFYELFTGQRLYQHDNETLETVRSYKLQGTKPTPSKGVGKALPWELETILFGGLEHEIADRYRSAEALERDLSHFLHDEPIEYRRPSLVRRVQLAYRRNRAVVNVSALAALLLVLGTIRYIVVVQHERNQADESFRQARAAVDDLFTRVSEDTLLNQPGFQPLRKELLQKTLDYYQRFLAQRRDDPSVRAELGATEFRAGRIVEELESPVSAMTHYETARQIQQLMYDSAPTNTGHLQALADTMNAVGRASQKLRQLDEADAAYSRAIEMRRQLVAANPSNVEYQRTLANSIMNRGHIAQLLGRSDQAGPLYDEAQAIRRAALSQGPAPLVERDLAKGHYSLAQLSILMQQHEAAREQLKQAMTLLQPRIERESNDLEMQFLFSLTARLAADLELDDDPTLDAAKSYAPARDTLVKLVDRNPDVAEYRFRLAGVLMNQGRRQETVAALDSMARAARELDTLVKRYPDDTAYRRDLAVALRELAKLQDASNQRPAARQKLTQAIQHLETLLKRSPNNPEYTGLLAETRATLEAMSEN